MPIIDNDSDEVGHLLWSITREPACYPNWTVVEPETWIHRLPMEKLLDWANSICLVFDFPFLKTSELRVLAQYLIFFGCMCHLSYYFSRFSFFVFCCLYKISLNDTPEFRVVVSFVPCVPDTCGSYLNLKGSFATKMQILQSFAHSRVV